ncbi:MAG: hypothetical protein FWG25_04600 [Promicromonosporaceae bacterium]|nr:hypothetical protein [Promicromonosporaceae bacterium]
MAHHLKVWLPEDNYTDERVDMLQRQYPDFVEAAPETYEEVPELANTRVYERPIIEGEDYRGAIRKYDEMWRGVHSDVPSFSRAWEHDELHNTVGDYYTPDNIW